MIDAVSEEYQANVEARVRDLLVHGAETLTDVCRGALGAFPELVVDVLRILEPGGSRAQSRWPRDRFEEHDSAPLGLPEPHPLDYEWRFTASGADQLAKRVADFSGSVACLGTPGVAWRLASMGREAVLYDRNPAWVTFAGTLPVDQARCDVRHVDLLSQELPASHHDVVVMDPPWYLAHQLHWLSQALRLVRPGGVVITTLFPPLLRPSANKERAVLLDALGELGVVQELDPVGYATPRFEQEVLDAAGLGGLGAWRQGDVVSVQLRTDRLLLPPFDAPKEPRWHRFRLGGQIVMVRREVPGSPVVSPLEPDRSFLLRSVSARHPDRDRIMIWTSRNRVALCSGTEAIAGFLDMLERGTPPAAALEACPAAGHDALLKVLALVGW